MDGRKFFRIFLITSYILIIVFGSGIFERADTAEKNQKTVTIAMTSAWDTFLPINSSSNYSRLIYGQIYSRLVAGLLDGSYVSDLAEKWEVNENSTEVTFYLDKNARWHDGSPLTAEDVVYTFRLYSNPKLEALSRYMLQYIAGADDSGAELSSGSIAVKAVDDYKVTVTLKSPMFYETLLNDLGDVFIVPKHIYEKYSIEDLNNPSLWENNPVGSGPFKYDGKIDGERVEFVSNPDYFKGAPKFDKLVIRVIPGTNLLAGLINGEVDVIAGGGLGSILLDDWDLAQKQENLVTESLPTSNYQTLVINTQKPYFTERARQAISMAVDRKALVESLLKGQGQEVITPISPLSRYYDPSVEIWYDPEKAKKILDEENFPVDKELVFLVPTGNTMRERASAIIEQNLESIGLKVQIQQVDFTTLMDSMLKGHHDFGIIGSGNSSDPSESRQMIQPGNSVNFALLSDPELANICDQGNAALTYEERLPYFQKYQHRMRDITPMAYLYTTNALMAYNKRLSNVNPVNYLTLYWPTWEWNVE
jgi:peptide/nickel transport system substrate-binding protein